MPPYTFDVSRLTRGHSFGNSRVYCLLDAQSDLLEDPQHPRAGLRDSITQAYFLYGWTVSPISSSGETYKPTKTTFTANHQETELRLGDAKVMKRFFVPYENNHLRSAHFVLSAKGERVTLEETVADVLRRDEQDTRRELAPLRQRHAAHQPELEYRRHARHA
jgi:hypothetical protein